MSDGGHPHCKECRAAHLGRSIRTRVAKLQAERRAAAAVRLSAAARAARVALGFRRGQAPTRATQALLSSRSDRIALGNVAEAPLRQRDKSLGDSLAESWPTEEFGESVSRQAIRRERGE
jgi:hypothetical protein